MSDQSNKELSHLVLLQEQKLDESMKGLNSVINQYKDDIDDCFHEDFETKIGSKMRLTKETIKLYFIFKQGYKFIQKIKDRISETRENKKNSGDLKFQDSLSIINNILYEWGYGYKIREDNRMEKFDNPRETEAYTAIRDELQKFVDDNKKEGIEITFSESGTPGNLIHIHFRFSEEVLQSKSDGK